ncbi:MAG: isoprenyl transferase [Bacteroidota bacterium]
MSLKSEIQLNNLPKHIAVIMDGNGRWAKKKGNARIFGHRSAIKAVRDTTEAAAEIGVEFLTLYAFSTENWKRPKFEVDALMQLLVDTIHKEVGTLMENDIRLNTIGNIRDLPDRCIKNLGEAMEMTSKNKRMTLSLALSYGARNDLKEAVRSIATQVSDGHIRPEDVSEEMIRQHLSTAQLPDPELLIRSSGEFRISNFLLWEIAYAELYITPVLWPDFRRENLYEAIIDYQKRERRFGKISEQISS